MNTFVALLRGINVGGKNKLPMKALQSLMETQGHQDVTTYIASGNVVFRSARKNQEDLALQIHEDIKKVFRLNVPVLLRTHAEMVDAASRNPFVKRGATPSHLYVTFLAHAPGKVAVARLDINRSPPDEFAVVGRDVYLLLPNGAARTKLTIDYLERQLETTASARNWNTVNKLVELSRP